MQSVFAAYEPQNYPYQFAGTLHVDVIAGGTPSNPDIAEAWLKTKIADKDLLIADAVRETMEERGIGHDEAVDDVKKNRHLSGFKRDERGLYVEGRQLKACIKEAASVALNAGNLPAKWGNTKKGLLNWLPEHVFVCERRLYLGVMEPTEVRQSIVQTFRGSGLHYSEIVDEADINFTVESDWELSDREWATIWLTAQRQGIGANRSQGFGTFTVTKWEPIKVKKPVRAAA